MLVGWMELWLELFVLCSRQVLISVWRHFLEGYEA